ncbi:hypothetical protein JK358_35605 [Nocardia sp. 2]|uniref:Secreted protein n=1 Tax=Nocardia acididurans TaxID=2802282 RepID=A0ABS1MGF1_9NOCA|nr:hypothetical protein [Nocardia acididurans]MBL1079741.1 hypothetical protein [Nocardia acididurans]
MFALTHRIPDLSSSRRPRRGRKRAVLLGMMLLSFASGAIQLDAAPARAQSLSACLWAGVSHDEDRTVHAGGWTFRCTTDHRGRGEWSNEGRTGQASTVPNPGATGSPLGRFSRGAQQPGTSYHDYCVGSQLIEGTDHVYEVVTDSAGSAMWKYSKSIKHWDFGLDPIPSATWRSSANCYDGVLG